MADDLIEREKLKADAGLAHVPTDLTYELRMGVAGEGARAYDWKDKPHRLVYDACREIEHQADRIRELEAERDEWKSASESILSDQAELGRILQDRIDQLTVERNGFERLARTAESRLAEAVVALERIDDEAMDWISSQIARQTLSRIQERN